MSNSSKAWERASLGEVCQILAGYGFPKHLQGKASGDLPFYKVGDISEAWKRGDTYLDKANHYISLQAACEIRARPLPENSTVFAKIGAAIALNRRAILSRPSLVDNNVMALHPATEALDHKYLFHFICTVKLDELSRATTVPSVRKSDIEQIAIPIPPLAEQKGIVAEVEKQFTRLDAGVAALRRVQANLKRYRAAVLKAACEGCLVPTEAELAKAEGRTYETGEQLLARILADRRKNWQGRGKYKEPVAPDITNLPPLPEGWAWCMSDALFFFVTSGSRGWAKYYSNDGAIFLRIGNLEHENIRLYLDDTQRVSPPVGAEGSRTRVQANDILISITADVGMIGLVPSGLGEAYINQHVALARPLPAANAKFIAYYLCASEGGWREFLKLQRGATKVGLGLDDIQLVPVPLPPPAEQTRIVAEVERRLSVIEELEAAVAANLRRAAGLRQSILQRAFSAEPSRREPSGLDARKQA